MITGWQNYINYKFPTPTDDNQAYFEHMVRNELPQAYWNIVRDHQGHVPQPGFFIIPSSGAVEQVGVFLHIFSFSDLPQDAPKSYSALIAYDIMCELYSDDLVPFSNDTGGNYLAFDFRAGGEPSIVFVDHELPVEDGVSFVAPNFDAFIQMLIPPPF